MQEVVTGNAWCMQKLLARTSDLLYLELGHTYHQSWGVYVVSITIQTVKT